jgi:ammonia channel protein AmtB
VIAPSSCAAWTLERRDDPAPALLRVSGTFAIITAALISGAIVERMRFGPYLAFITLWSLLVYAPWRTGCGAADGSASSARSTSPAARSCT